jgi:peptidoglycan/xylan/chitin deacetylase (PgdA/CDA1 family)
MKKCFIVVLAALAVLASCSITGLAKPAETTDLTADFCLANGDLAAKDQGLDQSVAVSAEEIKYVKRYMAMQSQLGKARSLNLGTNIAPLIILMYHQIVPDDTTDISDYSRTESQFRADMEYLKANDIKVVSFEDLREYEERGAAPDARMAIISMDDGYASQLALAVPILKEYKYKASFSISTSFIGSDPFFVDWTDLQILTAYTDADGKKPFTVASHTVTHASLLKGADWTDDEGLAAYLSYLKQQIYMSKENLERRNVLDENAALTLCLPYGAGSGKVEIEAMAKLYDYSFIRTSNYSDYTAQDYTYGAINAFTDDPWALPSLPILYSTDIAVIANYFAALPARLGFPAGTTYTTTTTTTVAAAE